MLVEDIRIPDAKIMLVGEAPGETEEKRGLPFVGSAGNMLKKLLRHSGINYQTCYVTNVVNERPPGNNFNHFYDDAKRRIPSKRLEDYWDTLRQKIERVKPNVVVPLGAEALRAITGQTGIAQWRGTMMFFRGIKVIPTYHPSYIMRCYSDHPVTEIDFAKALVESKTAKYQSAVPITTITKPYLQQTLEWLHAASESNKLGFDIEIAGDRIRCIGIARHLWGGISSICIPFIKFPSSDMIQPSSSSIIKIGSKGSSSATSYWTRRNEAIVLEKIAQLMANSKIKKVGQNSISFDAPRIMNDFKIPIYNHYLDTLHAWHVLYPEMKMSLSFLVSILTNHENYWTRKNTEDDMEEWQYNAMDAGVTLEISDAIEKELVDDKLDKLYFNHVHQLVFALTEAQQYGVKIDIPEMTRMYNKCLKDMIAVKARIKELTEEDINPNSDKQVKKLLYDKLKFPKVYGKNGRLTTDEAALRKLEKDYPAEPVLAEIIGYRKLVHLSSTFLNVDNIDSDGRMRTSYNASGTKNGRISSSKDKIRDKGLDLQNIPKGKSRGVKNIRHLFIAGKTKCSRCNGKGEIKDE